MCRKVHTVKIFVQGVYCGNVLFLSFPHFVCPDWPAGVQRDEASEQDPVYSVWDGLQYQWKPSHLCSNWSRQNQHCNADCASWNSPAPAAWWCHQEGWVQGLTLTHTTSTKTRSGFTYCCSGWYDTVGLQKKPCTWTNCNKQAVFSRWWFMCWSTCAPQQDALSSVESYLWWLLKWPYDVHYKVLVVKTEKGVD